MARSEARLLLTCEHGGHRVPPPYRALFRGQGALLRSHHGWDRGALLVARRLARGLRAPLIAATTTRLLVDLNRSAHNPRVFSHLTRRLTTAERRTLLARHHRPHWSRVARAVSGAESPILHLAVHTFTPVWQGERRPFPIGILYDPARWRERAFAARWRSGLARELGAARIRRNAPYRGNADGLTTALRRKLPERRYLGLELELNQAWVSNAARRRRLIAALESSLREALAVGPSADL